MTDFPPDSSCTWGRGPLHGCPHGDRVLRNGWGWGKIVIDPRDPDGKLYELPRVTTIVGALDDKGGLIKWSNDNMIRGLGGNRSFRDRAVVAANAGDEASIAKLRDEIDELSAGTRDRGTSLHEVTVPALLTGSTTIDDESMLASIEAARKVLAEADLVPVLGEQFMINIAARYCGTPDLICRHGATGKHHIVDIKGSPKLNDRNYPHKVAGQLACYSRGTRWCPIHGLLRSPEIDREIGFLLSVPLDKGEAYLDPINLELGWKGVQIAQSVREYRKSKPLLPSGLHVAV